MFLKKKKTSKFNTADIELYFDDSNRKNYDEENQILNFFNLGARKFPKFPKVQFPKIKEISVFWTLQVPYQKKKFFSQNN